MFSFILPIYNKEPFLDQCLDSIEKQTCEDIEIICVDNNSTDASVQIIERHAANDPRYVLVHEQTQGVSAARNRGLDVARGSHIGFIDADDYIEHDFAELALSLANEHDFDVLLYEYDTMYLNDGRCVTWKQRKMPQPVMSAEDLGEDAFLFSSPAVTTKVFKREFVENNGLRFNNAYSQGEDLLFSCSALMSASVIVQFQDKVMYHRHADVQGSATEIRAERGGSLQVFSVLDDLMEFVDERGLSDAFKVAIQRQALSEMRYAAEIASTPERFVESYDRFVRDWRGPLRAFTDEQRKPYEAVCEAFVDTESAFEALFVANAQRQERILKMRMRTEKLKGDLSKTKKARKKLQTENERLQKKVEKLETQAKDNRGFMEKAARKVFGKR